MRHSTTTSHGGGGSGVSNGSDDTEDSMTTTAACTADTASASTAHAFQKNTLPDAVLNGRKIAATTTHTTLSTVASIQMSPSSCSVLIVDKRFLRGVYYTTGSGSPTIRAGPARDDVVFVQELLEIYGQVVAVLSGDTALRWIFNHTGNKAIIVLIDVDDTYDRGRASIDSSNNSYEGANTYGPIYTPLASPHEQEKPQSSDGPESEESGPYGLALLRVIAHYVAIGVFRNVAPIGKTRYKPFLFFEHASYMRSLCQAAGISCRVLGNKGVSQTATAVDK
ncbi:hypothetical protein GGI07_003637 [Coemansia sp. Benny D115]|nr:hypothetical protein GGI07_003637 [Coemansia sp. Benny D115]